MVKVWIEATRKELALILRAARKLGVTVSQFVRREVQPRQERKTPKKASRTAQIPTATQPLRKRKSR